MQDLLGFAELVQPDVVDVLKDVLQFQYCCSRKLLFPMRFFRHTFDVKEHFLHKRDSVGDHDVQHDVRPETKVVLHVVGLCAISQNIDGVVRVETPLVIDVCLDLVHHAVREDDCIGLLVTADLVTQYVALIVWSAPKPVGFIAVVVRAKAVHLLGRTVKVVIDDGWGVPMCFGRSFGFARVKLLVDFSDLIGFESWI